MKIKTQEYENGQAVLHIEVETPELEKSMDEAYRDMSKKANVPGFRKGKIPRHILENYIGKEGLQQEALEKLIPQLCDQAMEEQNLEVIAQPQAEILELEPAVVFKAIFPLRPKVELGDYRSIRLDPETVEVTEEQIENTLDQLRHQHAVWEPVERPVQFEDMATLDIEQRLEMGEPMNYPGQQLPIINGSPLPVPGFAEQIVGMQKNEEKEFALSFPEDYEVPQLAGVTHNFKVKVTEIKERNMPELDDEFAKSLGENVETLDALRDLIDDRLRTVAEQTAKRVFEQKALEAAVEGANIEFPPVLVEQEIDRMLLDRDNMLQTQGGLEAYLKTMNKTQEEIREEIKPQATEGLKQSLVLGKLTEEEKIEISAADINAEIDNIAKSSEERGQELRGVFDNPQGRRWVHDRLALQKTVQQLTDIASGKVVDESPAEKENQPSAEASAAEEGGEEGISDADVVAVQSTDKVVVEEKSDREGEVD
jgi:trigger factor